MVLVDGHGTVRIGKVEGWQTPQRGADLDRGSVSPGRFEASSLRRGEALGTLTKLRNLGPRGKTRDVCYDCGITVRIAG